MTSYVMISRRIGTDIRMAGGGQGCVSSFRQDDQALPRMSIGRIDTTSLALNNVEPSLGVTHALTTSRKGLSDSLVAKSLHVMTSCYGSRPESSPVRVPCGHRRGFLPSTIKWACPLLLLRLEQIQSNTSSF
jgi:hypothetical protein